MLDERDLRRAVYHWIEERDPEMLVECWKEYHHRFDPAEAQDKFLNTCRFACTEEETGVIFYTDGTPPNIYRRGFQQDMPGPYVVIEDGKGDRVWPLEDLARFSDDATKRDVLDMDYDD